MLIILSFRETNVFQVMKYDDRYDKENCLEMLRREPFERKVVSFYRYCQLEEPEAVRADLFSEWSSLGVLGRIYLATEGINAQVSVPEPRWDDFLASLSRREWLSRVELNPALRHANDAFYKLRIKVRPSLVADGLSEEEYDLSQRGDHLSPEEFHHLVEEADTVVVDMRNHYETEIGHFKNAILPGSESFREELDKVLEQLREKGDKKVLLYCTGGIRCEKASAYLKKQGIEDVHQLKGGVISYAREIRRKGIESRFIGKNFVFDERLAEKVTDDVVARCHQCGRPSDRSVNCRNLGCNLLFIQCTDCAREFDGCCTPECQHVRSLSPAEQKAWRKQNRPFHHNKSRIRRQQLQEAIREQDPERFERINQRGG